MPTYQKLPTAVVAVLTLAATADLTVPDARAADWPLPVLDAGSGYGAGYGEAPAADRWTGAYGGLHAGWVADSTFSGEILGLRGSFDESGYTLGAQLGYDKQVGSFVIGAVADIAYTDLGRKVSGLYDTASYSASADVDWTGSLRARVGFAFDDFLIYGTGGVGIARVGLSGRASDPVLGSASLSDSNTHVGYVIGGGAEYKITENTSLGLEYLYTKYGKESYFGGVVSDAELDTHVVRTNFNVRF